MLETSNSVSVAIRLSNQPVGRFGNINNDALVMVRRKDNGLLSVPAGGLDQGENTLSAVLRELLEEAGIKPERLCGLNHRPLNIIQIPGKDKNRFGFIYEAYMQKPIPEVGYAVNDEDIGWVRPVGITELKEIVRRRGKGLYKVEYNLPVVRSFLKDVFDDPYSC